MCNKKRREWLEFGEQSGRTVTSHTNPYWLPGAVGRALLYLPFPYKCAVPSTAKKVYPDTQIHITLRCDVM